MDIKQIITIILSTFIFTAGIIPIIKKIAIHINAIDKPNNRKIHKKPMPRLGGLGIFSGFLFGYVIFGQPTLRMNAILISSFVIVITGIIDDIKPLRASIKLIGQIIAALIIALYGNILLKDITAFGFYVDFGSVTYIVTILFIVSCINALNFIDGLDGLMGGISAIFFLTIGIISYNLFTNNLEMVIIFTILGSTLGFLWHNFYPAKIFAGDSGSMFLGLIIAIISLLGFKGTALTSLFIPMLILTIPIIDTSFAILRRLIKRQPIYMPDKQHLHHQLLKMNFSHRNTVLLIYFMTLLLAITSIIYALINPSIGMIMYFVFLTIIIGFMIKTTVFSKEK
ncbi:MAG: undecaprenyl/decaprenyl-phosphate alpha-N-acetylglucosaminyl 1-phosphate transferase [Tenericutes bacterium]|nr:undecaprenyl/decaprenyl-phosphate alpha-N-acetylglucosaminyl 1-phosphate transferase [Mycoplasmatota bacterium]